MNRYSKHSTKELSTVHPILQECSRMVLPIMDHRVQDGGRTWDEQQKEFDEGDSTLAPPDGMHLIQDDGWAYAYDLHPYINGRRLNTEDFTPARMAQFAFFLGYYKAVSEKVLADWERKTGERYRIRFGVDWDSDGEILTDQKFQDWFHIELVREE